jgi:hypothetical protein
MTREAEEQLYQAVVRGLAAGLTADQIIRLGRRQTGIS